MHKTPLLIVAGCLTAFAAQAQVPAVVSPDVIAAARPSVVTVRIVRKTKDVPNLSAAFSDMLPAETGMQGSGFVIDGARGLIVTDDNTLYGTGEVVVTAADGRELPATIAGRDAISGVAVLRVADTTLRALSFCATPSRPGEAAVLIGDAYGVGILAIGGTVAATEIDFKTQQSPLMVLNMVVPNGTAGAPILSAQGCVTGMTTAVYNADGSRPDALGLAVPAARVASLSRELAAAGRISRSWIGVILSYDGQTVTEITPDGPAEKAGLKVGDAILGYDGVAPDTYDPLHDHITGLPVGTDVALTVQRGGKAETIKVKTAAMPDQ